ncbi:MAG: hypothetical protein P1V36_13085, partial [Planctomycetota bacterium]|nr:hypothetical protein [Planctomycetota bacterium]
MAALPRFATASLAATLLLLFATTPSLVRAEESAAAVPAAGAADTVEALLARWEAKPDSIGRGIRLQDAYVRTGKKQAALALFREKRKASPDDQVLTFLYGRIKGDRAGIKMMRSALAANLGRAEGDTAGLVRAWTALAVAEVSAGNGAEAEQAALRLSALRGLAEDWP